MLLAVEDDSAVYEMAALLALSNADDGTRPMMSSNGYGAPIHCGAYGPGTVATRKQS